MRARWGQIEICCDVLHALADKFPDDDGDQFFARIDEWLKTKAAS